MFARLKRKLYFPIASYFRFFAAKRLRKWHPSVIVVTGSNGKTTLLHMLESQLGDKAKFSHHANSSYGIPFDILDLHRKTLQKTEWFALFLKAPFQIFCPLPKEKIYVVEADADRPYEGKFLAEFLKPEIVLWVSTGRSHSMNFDKLVEPVIARKHDEAISSSGRLPRSARNDGNKKKFASVEEAIAYEYGYFLEYCKKLAVIDGDSSLEMEQIGRTKNEIVTIKKQETLKKYTVSQEGTRFDIRDEQFLFSCLLPEEAYISLAMCLQVLQYLDLPIDKKFSKFVLPPGRGSIFEGIKDITILDSSYNLTPSSTAAILSMYKKYHTKKKWLVLGDMLELGEEEKEEHEKLAEQLGTMDLERIIFLGPRIIKYTLPAFTSLRANAKQSRGDRRAPVVTLDDVQVDAFENPKEVLDFILEHIQGKETILFKGARFMEGIIEHLLKNKSDVALLARREKIWQIRRKQWGL